MTPTTPYAYNYNPVNVPLQMRRFSDRELVHYFCQPIQVNQRLLTTGRLQGNTAAEQYFTTVKNKLGVLYSPLNFNTRKKARINRNFSGNNRQPDINHIVVGSGLNNLDILTGQLQQLMNDQTIIRTLARYPAPSPAIIGAPSGLSGDIGASEEKFFSESKQPELAIITSINNNNNNNNINNINNNNNANSNSGGKAVGRGYYYNYLASGDPEICKYASNGPVTVNAYWDRGDLWTRSEDNDCHTVHKHGFIADEPPLFSVVEPYTYENINILSYFNKLVRDNPRNTFNKDKKARRRNRHKYQEKRFRNSETISVASYNITVTSPPPPPLAGTTATATAATAIATATTTPLTATHGSYCRALSPFGTLSPTPPMGVDCKSPELLLGSNPSSGHSSGRDVLSRTNSKGGNSVKMNGHTGGKFGAFKNYIFMAESFTKQLQTLVDPDTTLIDINRIYQFEIRYFQYCLLRGEIRFLQLSDKFLRRRNKDREEKEYIIWRFCHCSRARWNHEAIYGIGRRNKKIGIDNENYQPWECVAIQKQSSIIKYFGLQTVFRSRASENEFLNLLPKPFECEIKEFKSNFEFETNETKIHKLLTKGFEKYQAEEKKKQARMERDYHKHNHNQHSHRYNRYSSYNTYNNYNSYGNYNSYNVRNAGYNSNFNRGGDLSDHDDSSSGNNTSSGDLSISSSATDMTGNVSNISGTSLRFSASSHRYTSRRSGGVRKSKKLSNEDKFRYLEWLAYNEMRIEFGQLTKLIVDAIEGAFQFAQENKDTVLTQAYMDEENCAVNFENVILLEILDGKTNKTYKFGVPVELKGGKYIAKTILTPQMAIENILLNTARCGLPTSLDENSWVFGMRDNRSFYQQKRIIRMNNQNNKPYNNNNNNNNHNNNGNNNTNIHQIR